ncbi:unnamed protein product [Prunus armeniaca]
MGRALPLCPTWISPYSGIPAICAMKEYDHASHVGEYLGSFVLWPPTRTQPPIFGSAFWSQTWNVDSRYCHGLTAWHHFLLTPVLPGELLDLFPWRSMGSS